jgi:EamA domain-containing membrane protein RarD
LLGVCAVIFSAVLGAVFLKEKLNTYNYVGIVFAVLAIIFTNIKK